MELKLKILFAVLLICCFSTAVVAQKKTEKSLAYEGMVLIPAGSFQMGSEEGESDEKPVHTVYISQFWMDKYEVTNGEYKKCVDAGSCRAPISVESYTRSSYYGDSRYENYPVINVDWSQAKAYCEWKGGRLPTEAEWEYAARGGLKSVKYPNGDNINCGDANYCRSSVCDECKGYGDKDDDTHPVGSYEANGYGLYDMAGNIWEWVSDWNDSNYYKSRPPRDPQGPTNGEYRVVRGGSWADDSDSLRVSYRRSLDPTGGGSIIGFRCAR
jgi:formylglycine-generating enzyme required for sulfatase activity